jgi:hypothetical protein
MRGDWRARGVLWCTQAVSLVQIVKAKGTEAVFKEKCGVWDPMLELTKTSPYLIVDSDV